MVIQTLKENSVNYKFYTANGTLVQENLTDFRKTMAGTGKYRTTRRNPKWMTTKQGVQVSKMEAHRQVKPNILRLACEFSPLFSPLAAIGTLQERRVLGNDSDSLLMT